MDARRPNLGLGQRTEQRLALQPQLLQSIELLAVPAAELETWLREVAERNEALVVEDAPAPAPRGADATARHSEWLASLPDAPPGPAAGLREQVPFLGLDPELEPWVDFLIGCLDDDGLLTVPDERLLELAAEDGLAGGAERLGPAIAALQRLEPRGVGGRDREEALLLQLDPGADDYGVLCRVVERHLDLLLSNKLPQLARSVGLELADLEPLLARLAELDPAPARRAWDTAAPTLRADVVAKLDGESLAVAATGAGEPSVAVDDALAALAKDRDQPKELRAYARGKAGEARFVVEALDHRRRTLERVAAEACRRQRAFLERGPGHLVPLSMAEVAEALELAPSTVSRAVAGKHLDTPHGVVPLRALFPAPAKAAPERPRDEVREAVRAVFAAEDPATPLSDDEASAALAARGLRVARRTVAKYRRELGLPSSYRRRRYL